MRVSYDERRKFLLKQLEEMDMPAFEPKGAFYLFPDVTALGTGDEVAEMLLEKAHVATVSGSAFGYPSCIRLSYAISTEEIKEAMRRIKEALSV